jgi:hypothetical protein
MRDYVAPLVEMPLFIHKVVKLSRSPVLDQTALEPLIIDAYKAYPHPTDALSGLAYPSEEPLDEDESNADEARLPAYPGFTYSLTNLVLFFTIRSAAGCSDVRHTFIAPNVPKYPHA